MSTFENKMQFESEVRRIFFEGFATSERIRMNLVPTGTTNTAIPGSFSSTGIYKYTFNLKDGTVVQVKCHVRDLKAAKNGGYHCNSYRLPTTQIYYGRLTSGNKFKIQMYFIWDFNSNKGAFVTANQVKNDNSLKNMSHIPVVWTSEYYLRKCLRTKWEKGGAFKLIAFS